MFYFSVNFLVNDVNWIITNEGTYLYLLSKPYNRYRHVC